jgi:hypothetical protein
MKAKKFGIPAGTFPTVCREKSCGARIYFVRTDRGAMLPVNEDGVAHFATCPAAAKFRKGRK